MALIVPFPPRPWRRRPAPRLLRASHGTACFSLERSFPRTGEGEAGGAHGAEMLSPWSGAGLQRIPGASRTALIGRRAGDGRGAEFLRGSKRGRGVRSRCQFRSPGRSP